jgi:DNA-directed RNA polymerase subunit RPC12/RpoP
MKVNCLHCGHKFDLGHNYDDYDGLVRCPTCAGLLELKSEEGAIKRCTFGYVPAPPQTAGHVRTDNEDDDERLAA